MNKERCLAKEVSLKSMFGRENAKINSKNIWGGDRESGRDLEIEKKRIPFSHENMDETSLLIYRALQDQGFLSTCIASVE